LMLELVHATLNANTTRALLPRYCRRDDDLYCQRRADLSDYTVRYLTLPSSSNDIVTGAAAPRAAGQRGSVPGTRGVAVYTWLYPLHTVDPKTPRRSVAIPHQGMTVQPCHSCYNCCSGSARALASPRCAHATADRPPSTPMICPVTQLASFESKK